MRLTENPPGIDDAERRMDYLYTTRNALEHASGGTEPGPCKSFLPQTKIIEGAFENGFPIEWGVATRPPDATGMIGRVASRS